MSQLKKSLAFPAMAVIGHAVLGIVMAQPLPVQAQASGQKTWSQTLEAAHKEGAVAVVGPPSASLRKAILTFQKAFPSIRLEYSGMRTAEYVPRIGRERGAGQYRWDVVVGGIPPTVFTEQIPAGWYDPIKPALVLPEILQDSKWLGGFDAGFADTGKSLVYEFALDVTGNVVVNRDLVPQQALRDIRDLLDSRWKGKIVADDPRVGGPGSFAMVPLRINLGEESLKKLLVDQQPVFTRDGRQLVEWLVRGRYPIGIGVSSSDLTRYQTEGLGRNLVRLPFPVSVVGPGFSAVLLMNRAPHPNAARVFLNWLLGREAQQAWVQADRINSRRLDVPPGNPETRLDPKQWERYVNITLEKNMAMRSETNELVIGILK